MANISETEKEIEKLLQELRLVQINIKIAAAHMKDGAIIMPLADEVGRIRERIKADILKVEENENG